MTTSPDTPVRVSVVVPTRNRPDHATACVEAILANPGADFEVVLVDQSTDDATESAVGLARKDPRFRYVRSATRGSSASRNAGIAATRAPLLAFTDDDCRVPPDWVSGIERIFAEDADVAIMFGRVSLPEGGAGYGAEFEPHRREYQNCLPRADVSWGISANMAVRRSVLDRVGTFDPLLAAGMPLRGGEDTDLAIRVLASGMKIVNAKEVSVVHLGVRVGSDASDLIRGYGVAVGAMLMKHVRLGTPEAARLLAQYIAHFGGRGLRNAATGTRPTGLGLVIGILRGTAASWSYGIDRTRRLYTLRSSPLHPKAGAE